MPMTWIEEHFLREYPEIKSIQDIWDKDDLGGYQSYLRSPLQKQKLKRGSDTKDF